MSGICGIATVESHPVDEKILRYMTEAAPHRGLDGVTTWQNEHFSVAHLARFITPESQHEHQPLVSGPIILAADARIDNRDDLVKLLGLTGDTPTDADLILQAYQRWGTDFPRYLIGDFAFVLWDDHEKRLLLARDPMGMRALYYRLEANRVLFATEIKQIIAVPGVPVEIFEPALAAYLVGPNMPPEWTYYKGIDQLTAGHMLLFEGGRVRVQRFWDADPNYRIHYKDENEYVEHFRELFKTAVACRMRSIKPVGLSLSGGMDSGSIASMVGTLKQHGSTAYPDFVALCYAYDEYPQCDERHISSQITDYFGLESIDVPTNQGWPLIDYPAHGPDQDEPYMGVYQALYELALKMCQERNIGTLMSGDRGDLLTAGWSFDHRGMLFRGRWRKLWQELREDSAFRRRPILKIIRQEILPPIVAGT